MPLAQFVLYDITAFRSYILGTNFSRKISFIQNHHTWQPSYGNLANGRDEMYWLESMRRVHIQERGWNDIGQNITTFPSGKIAMCRPLNLTPAGIFGANTGAICIEHFGNFDEGADEMTETHKQCIVEVNALLCQKFGLKPMPGQVVYHHWYDTKGKRFSDDQINSGYVLKHKLQKTCPGTHFFHDSSDVFKGNTIECAIKHFYPLIADAMETVKTTPATSVTAVQKRVSADSLNVRTGKGTGFSVSRKLAKGTLVNVYQTADNWSKISVNAEEWVSSLYLV